MVTKATVTVTQLLVKTKVAIVKVVSLYYDLVIVSMDIHMYNAACEMWKSCSSNWSIIIF